MSFKQYVANRRITDTPQGDFTKDARKDACMPDAASWTELKAYLGGKLLGSNQEAVVSAARQVWDGYQRELRKSANKA